MRSSRRPPASPRTAALARQLEQATSVSAMRARSRHASETPLSVITVCTSAAPKQSKMAPSSPSSSDNERASWGAPHARAPPGAAVPGRGSVGGVSTDSDGESRCRWSERSPAIEKTLRICCGVFPHSRLARWSARCSSRCSHSRNRAARWSAKKSTIGSVAKCMLVSRAPVA
eukprot:scaffold43986_cov59-Phaeocystis_antarctica.AAC.4